MMKRFLNRALVFALCITLAAAFAGCAGRNAEQAAPSAQATAQNNGAAQQGSEAAPASDTDISASEATGEFSMTTADGEFYNEGSVYKVTAAGTYSLEGALEGQIIVEAGGDDEVILELNGATIKCAEDSPIKILSADKVEISAKSGTENLIADMRGEKTADDENQGEGAIYAKCDLKLKGTGVLVVEAGYNNGVHTTKDLTIQKLSLKVTAVDTAIKGGDSVTIKSGEVVAISAKGDGIKTSNTDANKSGEVRGDVTILAAGVAVYAAGDGIQAAHDFDMQADEEGNCGNLLISTGSYSSYTAESAETTSYKGVKVQNELNISAGSITLNCYDDGLHADRGTAFEAGGTGAGNINISGGKIEMTVYSPEGKTAGGQMGPGGHGHGGGPGGGWGGQQSVSGADAIHADNEINISGGNINIDSAYEGLEANTVNISGGNTVVAAVDDAVNACSGANTPQVNVTGGFLYAAVSPNGDNDGIDSNGVYSQSGGVVIACGPSSEMAAAIDAERGVGISGGTLIILGYGRVNASGSVKSVSLSLHSEGSHTITVGGTSYTFTNAYSYGRTVCCSDTDVSGS